MMFFFFQAEDGIRDWSVTGVQTCALPISVGLRAVGADIAVLGVGDVDEGGGEGRAACQCRHRDDPLGQGGEWFHGLPHLVAFSASHFSTTSATWRLFLSIIIMWLLPLMPSSG